MAPTTARTYDQHWTLFVRAWRDIGRSIMNAYWDKITCSWTCDGCPKCGY